MHFSLVGSFKKKNLLHFHMVIFLSPRLLTSSFGNQFQDRDELLHDVLAAALGKSSFITTGSALVNWQCVGQYFMMLHTALGLESPRMREWFQHSLYNS